MKAKEEMLQKIRSVLLCMSAHPDNEPDSEFEDRIDDLIEIESFLKNIPNQSEWIKIESEDDLPTDNTVFYKYCIEGKICPINCNLMNLRTNLHYYEEKLTHYKVCEIEQPPIY